MLSFSPRTLSSRVRTAWAVLALCAAASSGGCSLLVGGQLSEKPLEADGAGGGGGASSTDSQTSSSAAQSSSTGMFMCPKDTLDCDGKLWDGCEIHILTDNNNCGACGNECQDGKHCKGGKCE